MWDHFYDKPVWFLNHWNCVVRGMWKSFVYWVDKPLNPGNRAPWAAQRREKRHVESKGLAQEVSEGIKDSFRNWAGDLLLAISVKHLFSFCLFPVTQSEAELRDDGLICIAG